MTANSRTSDFAAGWSQDGHPPHQPGLWPHLMRDLPPRRPLSWFDPRVLWACRNDRLARISDPVPFERGRWVAGLTTADLTVDLRSGDDAPVSFLLVGDTGEGDHAQFAVAQALQQAPDAAFLVICSDVQYPLGDVDAYERTFFAPYRELRRPVYALPGNHDWYDDLAAFEYHVVGRTEPYVVAEFGADRAATGDAWWRVRFRRRLWHRPRTPDADAVRRAQALRPHDDQRQPVRQPGPYFVLDTGPVRLVCVDTGILGDLDEQQAQWLLEVSADPRPKLLLTGKPLLVDGKVEPCQMRGEHRRRAGDGSWTTFRTVLDVVHHPAFRYLGSIGGDIHNYQRYPVQRGDREFQHVVAGGGGAFMHATHLIDSIDGCPAHEQFGVTEREFRTYPLRMDSLAVYSRVLRDKLPRWFPDVTLTPAQAAATVYAERDVTADEVPERVRHVLEHPVRVPWARRFAAHWVLRVGGRRFHQWFSPFLTWNRPPFFRHFLRVDVTGTSEVGAVTVSCVAVTGYREEEREGPVEDSVTMRWDHRTY